LTFLSNSAYFIELSVLAAAGEGLTADYYVVSFDTGFFASASLAFFFLLSSIEILLVGILLSGPFLPFSNFMFLELGMSPVELVVDYGLPQMFPIVIKLDFKY